MISIDVDLSDLDIAEAKLNAVVAAVRTEIPKQLIYIQGTWLAAVQGESLPGMVRPVRDEEYAASITDPASFEYPFNSDPFTGRVLCTKPEIALRVEQGFPAFDMKPGLLRGPHAKQGKEGPYTTVPFTHTAPGTVGAKGQPMPDEIFSLLAWAKQSGEKVLHLTPEMQETYKRTQLTSAYNWPSEHPAGGALEQGAYTWKTSPYEGMVRVGRARHTSAKTFRRVSAHSDPNSWIHPGVSANPVMAAVQSYTEAKVQDAIRERVEEVLSQ